MLESDKLQILSFPDRQNFFAWFLTGFYHKEMIQTLKRVTALFLAKVKKNLKRPYL